LGLSVEGLSGVVANLTQAQGAVRAAVRDAAPRICSEQAGEVVFDTAQWLITVPEVQRRMLVLALTWIAGPVLPRGSGVDRVLAAIAQGRDTTLAGCRIRAGQARFRVVREPRAVAGLVTRAGIGGAVVWDGRWQVDGPFDADVQVRALGADGLLHCKEWRRLGISRDALLVSPAIWSDTALIAAPFAGFSAGFSARIVAGFDQFAVSH
jgi:tRNA(Ile)-lysidine synthase